MTELTVRGLTKRYGSTAVLTDLDLDVPEGALAAVLGVSGCGKTTLLRIVAGFVPADAGTISIGGRTVAGSGVWLPPERRRVGIVPQEGALFPHLTVAGNVGFGLPRAHRHAGRVEEMLALVGLAGYGRRMPHELSGGQQQRVALARALAPRPALVLLDEPFSALDTSMRAAVRADVRSALRAAGATAVLVTHDQQEALSMADQVAVLRDGRIVQSAAPADLYTRPVDLEVANFVGEAVVLPAELTQPTQLGARSEAECVLGTLPVHNPNGGSGTGSVLLRPEQLVVAAAGAGVPARVLDVEFFGHDALVSLAVPGSPEVLKARTLGRQHLAVDDEVGLAVEGTASFFPA